MPKRNIFAGLNRTPDGTCPKNPFDLTHDVYLTSKMGQYIPVSCIETVPDGKYSVGVDNYTFTLPCNTASMADMKENYYFLFIPYSQLFNSAYSFFPQRKDNQSALDYSYDKVPFFNLGDVVYRCILWSIDPISIGGLIFDIHGMNIGLGALKLLDMLGYGCYLDLYQYVKESDDASDKAVRLAAVRRLCNKLNDYKPNALRIAAYQKTWYCYFRNFVYDNSVNPRAFNFDDVVYHEAGVTADYNILNHRDIDNFIRECLQMRYVPYKKDVFTASMPGTQWDAVSSVSLSANASITGGSVSVAGTTGKDLNRWLTDPSSFAEDPSYDDPDYNYVRTQLTTGNTSTNPDTYINPDYLRAVGRKWNANEQDYDRGTYAIQHDHTFNGTGTMSGASIASGSSLFNVLQLVEAQAIQKWRQKSMLAGQRAQNQYRAHYGVVPKHLEDHYPDFFGSVDNLIDIDKVINAANTATDTSEETNLGDLGGRGFGVSDKQKFTYHAKEHGIIMILRSIVPENVYSSFGLDRANQLINYSDFWQPEYQNIGLESVPKTLLDITGDFSGSDNVDYQSAQSYVTGGLVLGFAPRNYQLKAYPSKTHGMFNPVRLTDISAGLDHTLPYGFLDIMTFAQSRSDLVSRLRAVADPDYTKALQIAHITYTLDKFYVSPFIADNTFIINADGTEQTDQFMHKCKVICDALQPLSPIGLPQF